MLQPVTLRVRDSWTVSFEKHLAPTAAWIDEQLTNRPDIRNRHFTKLCLPKTASGQLRPHVGIRG